MHSTSLNKNLFKHSDIICLGSKTRLCKNLFNQLNKNCQNYKGDRSIFINNYVDANDFFLKNKSSCQKFKYDKALLFLCATGGVQALNHNNMRSSKCLDEDLELIRYFNKNWNEVSIVYVSSVLGLCNSKKNRIYSLSKMEAENKLSLLISECCKIKNFSVLYPGRIIEKWFRYFISGSISYSRLAQIMVNINKNKKYKNYFLIGLDALIFAIIKRPSILKELSIIIF